MTDQRRDADEIPVARAATAADAVAVLGFLAGLEQQGAPKGWVGLAVPMVDESESARLERLAADELVDEWGWTAVRADRAGRVVGYAGLRDGPATAPMEAVAELAVDPDDDRVLRRLAGELVGIARVRGAQRLAVWLRRVVPEQVATLSEVGLVTGRRLAVLGLADSAGSDAVGEADVRDGIRLRRYRAPDDEAGVIAVLDAAYRDGPEGRWDEPRFALARRAGWFRSDDLIVAERVDDDQIVGVHWTKRRSATLGEVHNLAVDPRFHGRGVGGRLLDAGLAHLRQAGCTRVILWMDESNTAALALYTQRGFQPLWQDVEFHLADSGDAPGTA